MVPRIRQPLSLRVKFGASLSVVRNCTVTENGGPGGNEGIRAQNSSLVEGNKVYRNNGRGIHVTGNLNTPRQNDLQANCLLGFIVCGVFGYDISFDSATSGNMDLANVFCSWANNSSNLVGGPAAASGRVDVERPPRVCAKCVRSCIAIAAGKTGLLGTVLGNWRGAAI